MPSRAVATTRNSPSPASPPPSTSPRTRRIKALSSATTTVGRLSDDGDIGCERADFHATVLEMKARATRAVSAGGLARDGDRGGPQRAATGEDVALAHLNRARRDELAEHAGASRELGDEAPGIGAERLESLDEERNGGVGELGFVRGVARQADRWQQHVRHAAGADLGIVEHDRHTPAETQRDDDGIAASHGPVGDPDNGLLSNRFT